MRINLEPNTMIFEGLLDENTSLVELKESLKKLSELAVKSAYPLPVVVDFSKVVRANSSGILTWLRFLQSSSTQFKYVNAPTWLVGQFNIVSGYFENGSFVYSFYVPFYAPKTRSSKNLLMTVGVDIQIQTEYASVSIPSRMIDGDMFEIDFEPNRYFSFIKENYKNFKKEIV